MSDTTYEVFQHYGTSAERLAFTPAPAAGIQPLYIWYETDTGKTYLYHTAWSQMTGGGTSPTPLSYLVEGGAVVWLSSYNFRVSAATYYILGIPYASAQTDIVVSAADPANPRIDVVAVNTSGNVVVVEGTAAATPSEPDIDPSTQLKLAIILIPANSPPVVTNEVLYYDAAGAPGEWNWTASGGSGFVVNSVNNPKAPATHCIEGTTVVNSGYVQGEKGAGTYDPNDSELLILYIRSKASWASGRSLIVSLRLNDVLQGVNVTIARTGTWGFNSATTGTYQLIAIPTSSFAVPAGTLINQIRITASGAGHGFYIADIFFQVDGATPPPSYGITQEEADARYLQRANNLSDLTSSASATAQLDNMVGDAGVGGTKGLVPAPAVGDASNYLKGDGTWDTPSGTGINQLTGEVTAGPGAGAQAATIANDAVINAKLANMAEGTIKGRKTAGAGDPEDLNAANATSLLADMVGDSGAGGTKGLVPAPGAGDAAAEKYLKADGTWDVPAGTGVGDVVGPAGATNDHLVVFDGATGKLVKDGGVPVTRAKQQITVIIDGAGSAITTGVKGFLSIPFACTITKWRILSIDGASTAGAIKIDVWKDTYANYPPTDADSITNAHEPEIAANGSKAEDNDLGDWSDITIDAGDILGFNVDSAALVTKVALILEVQP